MPKPAEYDAWAEYYDLMHEGLPGEAEFYVGQAVHIGGDTLELGCGTGRLAIPMAMSGVRVTGLDNSKAMLDVCRAKRRAVGKLSGKLKVVQADMRDFDIGQTFDFIVMAYRTFMHLLTPEDQRRCLENVRRHLSDSGVLIFNCWVPKPSLVSTMAGPQGGLLRFVGRHEVPGGDTVLLHFCATSANEFNQRLYEEHVIHEADKAGRVLRTETLTLDRAWITPREMSHLVHLSGFDIEAVFGDFDCAPLSPDSLEMIWVLRSRG